MNRMFANAMGKRLTYCCIAFTAGLLGAARLSHAQTSVWSGNFGGSYNEGGYASTNGPGQGHYAVGSTYSFGQGDHDLFVLRLDSLGDTVWTRTFGGALADFGRDLVLTSDSGCIVVGSTASSGAGKEDLIALEVSADGDLRWTKTYGGPNTDEAWSVRKTRDGNLIVCGSTSSSGAGYADMWLLKLTLTGDSIWTKTFGGPGGESGMSVREGFDGYIAVGSTGSFGEGYSSIYAVKVGFSGDSIWAATFGGPKADMGHAVEVSPMGDYLIAGATGSYGLGYNDAYLLDITPSGDLVWEKTYGGTKDDRAYSVCTTQSGDIIVGGTTESSGSGAVDMYLLRLNPVGDLIWSNAYGGPLSDYCRHVAVDGGGNLVLTGYSYSYSKGGSDLYLLAVTGDASTDVDEISNDILPDGFAVEQNFPNPFNGTTHIRFEVPHRTALSLRIVNILGQEVRRWDETIPGAGTFQIDWDGRDAQGSEVASGVYLYVTQLDGLVSSKKMLLVK